MIFADGKLNLKWEYKKWDWSGSRVKKGLLRGGKRKK